jgi:hypothetical protein
MGGGGEGGVFEWVVMVGEGVVVAKGKVLKSRLPRRSEKRKALGDKSAGTQHRHRIRAERVPTSSSPWGLLATTPTSGTGPKTSASGLGSSVGAPSTTDPLIR